MVFRRCSPGLGLVFGSLLAACGSNGGTFPGDEQPVADDASIDTTAPDTGNPQQDSGPVDSTVPPNLDATLDVNFGDGAIWTADSGNGGTDSGQAGGPCAPDGVLCSGNVAETCKNGQLTTTTCPGVCADGYGCVTCVPGSGSCNGSIGTLCKSDGSGTITNNCDSQLGLACNGGVCTGDCSESSIGESYIGCEYYAVTMLNDQLDQGTFPFAITVANTTAKTATVNINGPNAVAGSPFTVPANTIQSIVLPWEHALSCGAAGTTCNGITVPPPPTTELVTGGAYHIKSNEPVTVYQFNARDYQINTSYSYTNDASLLLPVNAMSGKYYAASYPSWAYEPGLLTIVGTQAGTSVTVSPSVKIVAGGGLTNAGGTVTLNAGDVLQITAPTLATQTYGNDMSGSLITATAPVEVFGGQGCVYIPYNVQACDHMEEVIFPYETLKTEYYVIPPNQTAIQSGQRLTKPSHWVKIVGTAAGTSLTYNPPPTVISGTASTSVGLQGVVTFETATPFRVTASSPVLVATYMEGSSNYCTPTNPNPCLLQGDPAMSLSVTTSQYRNSYAFTAPNNYQINWATLIAPANKTVTVDTTTVSAGSFTAIGTTGYGFYYYPLCNGNCGSFSSNHTASSSVPFGVQVYGYGSYTSYWYPGGLNLTR